MLQWMVKALTIMSEWVVEEPHDKPCPECKQHKVIGRKTLSGDNTRYTCRNCCWVWWE